MAFLFGVTIFLAAVLLFVVQPMVGKSLLRYVGGSPAVWNTCMVFFQAMLLAGYAYAHAVGQRAGQTALSLHAVVVALPLALFGYVLATGEPPLAVPAWAVESVPGEDSPIPWLLGTLLMMAGLPFFVTATTTPLLQRWFARTPHPAAADPYFLYAASNAGSLIGLLAYPLAIEPHFTLAEQGYAWAGVFVFLAVLLAGCGWYVGQSVRPADTALTPTTTPATTPTPMSATKSLLETGAGRLGLLRRLRWVMWGFVPSSMLLGVTTYITTDLTPVPLLWIVPLGLYLLSFIIVFGRRAVPLAALSRLWAMLAVVLLIVASFAAADPYWILPVVHLLGFFVVALMCHGQLAADRPPAESLTEFYLLLSLGGVLGGAFNALLAPVLFANLGLLEYPLAIILAVAVRPLSGSQRPNWGDIAWPLLTLTVGIAGIVVSDMTLSPDLRAVRMSLVLGTPAVLAFMQSDRNARYAACLLAALIVASLDKGIYGRTIDLERNFFGVVRVTEDAQGQFRQLYHGNTLHGQMNLTETDPEGRHYPLTYYFTTSPIGRVLREEINQRPGPCQIAAVGLGTGSLAYYATEQQDWTFYEIDPAVARIATDPQYFLFWSECRAKSKQIVLGDARLRLANAQPNAYRLIVLDAFSSDAIPMHLLTIEALQLYLEKLEAGGIIAYHVSNRYMDLRPIIERQAQSFDPPLAVRYAGEGVTAEESQRSGYSSTNWVIVARSEADLGKLGRGIYWSRPEPRDPPGPLWRDDYSNILSVLTIWRRPTP